MGEFPSFTGSVRKSEHPRAVFVAIDIGAFAGTSVGVAVCPVAVGPATPEGTRGGLPSAIVDPVERPEPVGPPAGTLATPSGYLVLLRVRVPRIATWVGRKCDPAWIFVRLPTAKRLGSRGGGLPLRSARRCRSWCRAGWTRPACLLKCPQPVLRERSEYAIGELLEIRLEICRVGAVHDRLPEHHVLFR